ncbi:peptidoglycan DD-metalloendopeptidase family protein [Streptomyces qinzhouensis]|uniref:Peptidoglycan DD-metalloendopeptidase family protein n=1 Tax=Streptomyces qinzhouensis TaxID=2599401 RepID=A0A5B8JSK3_9ACTN|nr:peptidoglycan DD-metalloendopeptidase family protein [Streptomyces qinzhouensis]
MSVLVMAVCVLLVPGPAVAAGAGGTAATAGPAGSPVVSGEAAEMAAPPPGERPGAEGRAGPEPGDPERTGFTGHPGHPEQSGPEAAGHAHSEDSTAPAAPGGGSRAGAAGPEPSHGPAVTSTSAEVARLFEAAVEITAAHERSRRAAGVQRAALARLQEQLARRRTEVASLHDAVGAIARDQYRTGGQLTATAGLLLARDPDELMRGRRAARQAETAVQRLLARAGAAAEQLASAEERARRARHDLDVRTARLARVRQGLERRLEAARWALGNEAEARAAAGTCAGPARGAAGPEPGPGPGASGGPAWVPPVDRYQLSASFGSGGERWAHRHTGQDFAVDIGTPVRSVGAGRVLSVSCAGAFGIQIVVRHPGGYYTQYAHLSAVAVGRREWVRTGQVIGLAGSTGNSTGPHLHFEVRLTPYLGSGVDPAGWLRERGVALVSASASASGSDPG